MTQNSLDADDGVDWNKRLACCQIGVGTRMNWHILGNGPNSGELNITRPVVVFNQGYPSLENPCRVSNQRLSHAQQALSVTGPLPFDGFEASLNQLHQQMQVALQAVPSSGLCCLMAFAQLGLAPSVSRMNLLPNLTRPADLPSDKPMGSYFHNWLAERRVMLPVMVSLDWPEFYLQPVVAAQHDKTNPYPLLARLTHAGKTEGLALLEQMADIAAESWLYDYASHDITAFDRLFYLERSKARSANWWLFDNSASAFMARVHYQLAWVQQQHFLKQV